MPDATMIFVVELTNAGISALSFNLFLDNRVNSGLLNHALNFAQQYYEIGSFETITATVMVTHSPIEYNYPELPVEFASCACIGYITRNIDHKDMAWASLDLFNFVDGNKDHQHRVHSKYICEYVPKHFWYP